MRLPSGPAVVGALELAREDMALVDGDLPWETMISGVCSMAGVKRVSE